MSIHYILSFVYR